MIFSGNDFILQTDSGTNRNVSHLFRRDEYVGIAPVDVNRVSFPQGGLCGSNTLDNNNLGQLVAKSGNEHTLRISNTLHVGSEFELEWIGLVLESVNLRNNITRPILVGNAQRMIVSGNDFIFQTDGSTNRYFSHLF